MVTRRRSRPTQNITIREFTDSKGFVDRVVNPTGKKGNIIISQGIKGWQAAKVDPNKEPNKWKVIKGVSQSSEKFARKLARQGYKRVEIRD